MMKGKKVVAGVDVASEELVVRISSDGEVLRFRNEAKGIRALLKVIAKRKVDLLVCEATGRHEWNLLQALWAKEFPVHCAQPKAVHNFAKALKANAKTDPIDAGIIMEYGLRMDLPETKRPAPEIEALRELVERRQDLNQMLVQEKNRLGAPGTSVAHKRSVKAHISYLEKALEQLSKEMQTHIDTHPTLKARVGCLDDEYGVGLVAAATLYATMPELGSLNRQTVASLAGLAPFVRASGKFRGQSKISGGRTTARSALYMVALTTIRNKKSPLRDFYLRLKKAGKHTSVALTAVMRKLVIYLNTRMKIFLESTKENSAVSA